MMLTAEQQSVIDAFAAKYGKSWKNALRTAWMNGSDTQEPDGHVLRQIRNTLGPKILTKI